MDAVHYAPHQLVDVQAIGCDFLACSAYKFYGPHIGILWGKRDIIERAERLPSSRTGAAGIPRASGNGHAEHEGITLRRGSGGELTSLPSTP